MLTRTALTQTRRAALARRLLSTSVEPAGTPPTAGSKTAVSRALIAASVAAPVGFVAYKWQFDPEFQNTLKQAVSGFGQKKETPVVTPPVVVEPIPVPAVAPAPTVEVAQPPQHEETPQDEKIFAFELDELERKLVPSVSVTYPKDEVASVEKKIKEAEQEAEKKEENEAEQAAKQAKISNQEESAENGSQAQRFDRQAIEAIRAAAKGVETAAATSSKSELSKAEAALRADIERVLAKDLTSLTEEGLRERIVQLTLELKDRNRWEAIRLHEVVTKTIEDLSQKYLAMMKEQEAAYETVVRAEVSNAAMEAAAATEDRLSKSLQERLARQREALRMEMELNIEKARDEEREVADVERKQRTAALHEMETKLVALEETLRSKDRARTDLLRSKRAALAALRFARATLIEKSTPQEVEESLTSLRLASAGDQVVSDALDALPHRVFASGVASIHKLAKSFETEVKPDILRASLIPENASLVQQALARATTALMITGKPSASPLPDDDSLDAKCSRIQALLDQEDLIDAFTQAESLPANIVEKSVNLKDWLAQAQDRLRVEAAIRLLTARFEERE